MFNTKKIAINLTDTAFNVRREGTGHRRIVAVGKHSTEPGTKMTFLQVKSFNL